MSGTAQLLEAHQAAWLLGLDNPFRMEIRLGTLPPGEFTRWLAQTRPIDEALFVATARLLAQAPPGDRGVLLAGLAKMERDRAIRNRYLARRRPVTDGVQPPARAYGDFLLNAATGPYAVGITTVWAVSQARLDGWSRMEEVGPTYRNYVDANRTPALRSWVGSIRAVADAALGEASVREIEASSAAFQQVVRYELDIWAMALDKAPPLIVT